MNSKSSILLLYFVATLAHASSEANTRDKFAGSLGDERAVIGFTARIKCHTPRSAESPIKWLKNNVEVIGNRYSTLENGDLQITNVQFSDQGAYVCNAQDSFTTVSSIKKLIVQPPTQILELNTTDHEVTEGDQIGFKCVVLVTSLSTLQELKIIWLHNGTVIDHRSEAQRFRKVIKSYVVVSDSWIIKNAALMDAGKYTCVASTSLDNATAEKPLFILPKKQVEGQSPDFVNAETVRSVKAIPLSSSALHLSWEKPEIIFGTLVGYNISYQVVNETGPDSVRTRFKNITDFYPTIVKLNNLKEKTKYKIIINAVTTVGPGETFSIEEETMKNMDDYLFSRCAPVFHLDHSRNRTSSEYGSSKNETVTIVWKPWADCVDLHSKYSLGSQFSVKYRTLDRLCFNQTKELNEEYVLIPDLHFNTKYQFIVEYVDGKRTRETLPIYLEFYPKSNQRSTDDIHRLTPELIESIETTPFINASIVGKIMILLGIVLFILVLCGFLTQAIVIDIRKLQSKTRDIRKLQNKTRGPAYCAYFTSLIVWIIFLISFFGYFYFILLTFEPSSEVLCFT